MTILYTKLARAYHEMYQSIFDYKADYEVYDSLLKKYNCSSVLEIGCGSGNLASYFISGGYDYTGLDIAEEMLGIAKELNQGVEFIKGDMRNLDAINKFDAIVVSGRSFTYMTTNADVLNALRSIHKNLKQGGILIFDNFNAEDIFLNFRAELDNSYEYGNKKYRRISNNSMNLEHGWTWNWEATYHIQEQGKDEAVFQDKTILRAFTEDELSIFLKMAGFNVTEVMKDGIFLFVAKKQQL